MLPNRSQTQTTMELSTLSPIAGIPTAQVMGPPAGLTMGPPSPPMVRDQFYNLGVLVSITRLSPDFTADSNRRGWENTFGLSLLMLAFFGYKAQAF